MVYTPSVPQATQTIALTQPLIEANFQFIDAAVDVEHNFDNSDATLTYHKKASMPNQADPGSLPTGTNGQYYVSGGVPKFYNTSANFIQLTTVPYKILTGTQALTPVAATLGILPANSVGQYYVFLSGGNNTVNTKSAIGFFNTDSNSMFLPASSSFDPGLDITSSGLALRAATSSAANNGTYTYLIIYYNP
jgi:hypothetical protein